MTETITYDKNGQWSLNKTAANHQREGADFNSYRRVELQGSLKEDHGQKGRLHNNPPHRAHQTSKNKMKGKVTNAVSSDWANKNPGLGDIIE